MSKLNEWLNSFTKGNDPSLKPKEGENIFKKDVPKKETPNNSFERKQNPQQENKNQIKYPPQSKPQSNPNQGFNNHSALKIIPLGGVDDTGTLNCNIVEYKSDILIIDAGLGFPEEEHPGVDYLIPNMEYLKKNKTKIRGILITHGHLDHIGALPHFLLELNFPVIYASRYALALIRHRLKEFKIEDKAKFVEVPRNKRYKFGSNGLEAEWIHINHSLPDARCIYLKTPEGNIFFTGDFKIDYTPEKEECADFEALTRIGKEGVDLLLSDSLGVQVPGHVASERVIRQAFEKLFEETENKGRLIIGLTASNSNRFQQIIDTAAKYGRKIGISGRSLETNMRITQELGYLKEIKGVLIPPERLNKLPDNKIVFLVTGSQGEEFAALNRIASGSHKDIQIKKGDTIVFSASEIPGNERSIAAMRNKLMKQGANVVNNKVLTIHSGGHGCAEDKRLLLTLLKPKYFLPYHGEYQFRNTHADIAVETGVLPENVFLTEDGLGVEMFKSKARLMHEKIPAEKLVVDGNTVSSQEGSVLGERRRLGENGILILLMKRNKDKSLQSHPKLLSKGFLYEDEFIKMTEEFSKFAFDTYKEILSENPNTNDKELIHLLSKSMQRFILKRTDREPIVTPVIINI